ncbi:MAG: hypothetical protein F4Z15_07980 [Gammaproteobacteria bacterium]|nr:hypothetical protein [Gammaproteobacteria bacterium]MYD77311.1 hypothetical protein [Gammaproteobacteria bacterium]
MSEIPHFKIYGEDDPGIESRIQPTLPLRDWEFLTRDEKEIALCEFRNKDSLLDVGPIGFPDNSGEEVLELILYLNHRFLRTLPGKQLHNANYSDEVRAARADFCNIFLEESSELVLVMLSTLLSWRINTSLLDEVKEAKDNEIKNELINSAFREFDSLANVINHIFEQFCVNIWITRSGVVPRQDDKIIREVYVPVLKVLSDPKWKSISDNLSNMFADYQKQAYPEVITKAHSTLQGFLQILVGIGKNGKGELSRLFAHAKKDGIISDNLFSQGVIGAIQSYIVSERANNSTAKPSLNTTTPSDALLAMNVLMVFLQHCLHNSEQNT